MPQSNSDSRILSILMSGENMRLMIDPDGILKNARVIAFSYSMNGFNDAWSLRTVFPSGDILHFAGVASEDNIVFISAIVFQSGEAVRSIPVTGIETVVEALGDLSRLPVQLKRNFAVLPAKTAKNVGPNFICRKFFTLAKDALFYGVDGGEAGGQYRDKFKSVIISFTNDSAGEPCSVLMRSMTNYADGRIFISSDVDIYGLNKKNVKLRYDLGLGGFISSECFLSHENKTSPSLKVAFELAELLSDSRTKQRKKKSGLGKPKAR